MNIPNYDRKSKILNFKQLYPYMPEECFRMLICGNSGSGKTNTLIHMLMKPLVYYDKLYLYAKNLEQDKYKLLTDKLEKVAKKNKFPLEEIFESFKDEIINVDDLESDLQTITVFDDYVCERNQNDIINYFIQGRHKNCCVIYLTQSYYKTPKDIRLNCSHYIFFESPSKNEMDMICREQGIDKDCYKNAVKNRYDFLYLDKPKKQYKRNFYGDV